MSSVNFYSRVNDDEAAIACLIKSQRPECCEVQRVMNAVPYAGSATPPHFESSAKNDDSGSQRAAVVRERWATPVEVEWRNLKVAVRGNVADCEGLLHISGTKRGAGRAVDIWRHARLQLQRAGDAWSVVYERFGPVLGD
ncbi:MAG: hypothetical protein WA634_09375 [Silvibacterium sp.]